MYKTTNKFANIYQKNNLKNKKKFEKIKDFILYFLKTNGLIYN